MTGRWLWSAALVAAYLGVPETAFARDHGDHLRPPRAASACVLTKGCAARPAICLPTDICRVTPPGWSRVAGGAGPFVPPGLVRDDAPPVAVVPVPLPMTLYTTVLLLVGLWRRKRRS